MPPRSKKKSFNSSNNNLVRTQSGQIVPPRLKKSQSNMKIEKPKKNQNVFNNTFGSLVRTQSGQIVPPRRSRSNLKLDVDDKPSLTKVPPTPPKRKKHLQIEKINQLFMNLVNSDGQQRMQLGIRVK